MKIDNKHKRVFIIWLGIYPLITLLLYLLGDVLVKFPLPLRSLMLTAIAVPVLAYIILPILHKIFENWLNH
jgi:antibiotic biosynthesis monooxygenase (ABM) superfamily enzyme